MHGQNVVYANLAGDMAPQARAIVDAMHTAGIKRLIFISSMGIYSEVPGEKYRSVWTHTATPQQSSRSPTWTTRSSGQVGSLNDANIEYRLTQKGEPFQGHDVSLNSLSDLIVKLALSPTLHTRSSLGVSG